jgi:C-8 sterol isomerase
MGYRLDPDRLHEVARRHAGRPLPDLFEALRADLAAAHPGRIARRLDWFLNTAGGCNYSVTVLHASLYEYLLIFGSQIGTSGHTGRHLSHVYDFVLDGELWYHDEPRPWERLVRRPGDRYELPRLRSEVLRIPDRAWVLEYARGPIPLMLPFGLAGAAFTTLDFISAWRVLAAYARAILGRA